MMTDASNSDRYGQVICIILSLLLCTLASADIDPPECCPPTYDLYASYESSLMLYGKFFGAEFDSDHLCLRWVDNANGYFEHTIHEAEAADADACGNEDSFAIGSWVPLLGKLQWTWSGAPGIPVADVNGNDRSFRVRVPIEETQSYDLKVEVEDVGGDCAPVDSAPHHGESTASVTLDIWAPTHEIVWTYKTTIPTPYITFAGRHFNGGTKTTVSSTTRIEKHTANLFAKYCRIGAGSGSTDVWHALPTFSIGTTNEYATLGAVTAICDSWGVNGTPGAIICTGTANPEICVDYERISQDEIKNATEVSASNPCVAGPAIDGKLTVRLRAYVVCNSRLLVYQFMLSGNHDGFPMHEVTVVGTAPPYVHDPCVTGEGPSALWPPAEHSFPAVWTTFRSVSF